MNVLFLSTENPYPPDSGHLLRTYNILRHAAREHDVYFLGFIKKKEDAAHAEPIRKMCKTADVFVIPDDVSRARLGLSLFLNLFSPLPYISSKYYRKDLNKRMMEIIRNNRIDVVHFDMLHMARYRRKIKDLPSVLVEHNVESLRLRRLSENSKNPILKLFLFYQYIKLYRFERREPRFFDVCTPVSRNDADKLEEMGAGGNLTVIPNGVDTEYFKPGNKKATPQSLVWVGSMSDMYNAEAVNYFCEEVFPLILREMPDIRFTAVGKSPTKKLLRLAAANSNVKAVGYVDDVRGAMERAAVYIAPIRSGGGTKLKVLNALSMARPVVTTTVGAEGIEVVDGEHLLIADDAKLFAEKTIGLLRDPARAAGLGENGRRLMLEKYDWDIIGGKMNSIYEDLLKGKTRKDKKMRVNG